MGSRVFSAASLVAGIGLLFACGGSSGGASGTLNVNITDAAVDGANAVVVKFDAIELHGAGGTRLITLSEPKTIDLMQYQGDAATPLLADQELPAGTYQWMRLSVITEGSLDTYIDISGAQHELTIPSSATSGLKLNRPFTIPANGTQNLTIDFDLRKSVHESAGGYVLRPTLRMVDNSEVGHVSGTVDGTLLSANCPSNNHYAVYAYSGSGVTPDDEGSAAPPVTTALVAEGGGNYSYEIGFLEAGAYTLALTCDADQDDSATDDAVAFFGQTDVTIFSGQTVTLPLQ